MKIRSKWVWQKKMNWKRIFLLPLYHWNYSRPPHSDFNRTFTIFQRWGCSALGDVCTDTKMYSWHLCHNGAYMHDWETVLQVWVNSTVICHLHAHDAFAARDICHSISQRKKAFFFFLQRQHSAEIECNDISWNAFESVYVSGNFFPSWMKINRSNSYSEETNVELKYSLE